MIKDNIGLFLPVIGTWMGTVLAFYFTRQNFEAANRSMQQTIDKLTTEEKLKTTNAKDVMIPFNKIDAYSYKEGETWDTVPVSKYIEFLTDKRRERLIVFNPSPIATGVFHKSALNEFLYREFNNGKSKDDVNKITLKDLPDIKKAMDSSLDFVSQHATLFEAQQRMTNTYCSDVFITANGKKDEPIIGWVTNVIVAEWTQTQ